MTDETYFNIKINIEGDGVKINKEHNLKETLHDMPPAAGVYIATLVLALEKVIQNDEQLVDVIHLVCTPDEATRVNDALQAVKMLITIDEMMEKSKSDDGNGGGKPRVDTPPDQN